MPDTEAGKRLLAEFIDDESGMATFDVDTLADTIAAIEAEARAFVVGYRCRLIRVAEDITPDLRTADGYALTFEWGDPDEVGVYEPSLKVNYGDDIRASERERIKDAIFRRSGREIREMAEDAEKALHCAWPTVVLRIFRIIDEGADR